MNISPQSPQTPKAIHANDLSGALLPANDVTLFESAQEAWFWFIAAQNAKNDGARFVAGAGLYKRPCEPIDILKTLDRLHRNRRLNRDHLLVLRHYGRRHMAPDLYRKKEVRAYHLWNEALERIEEVLVAKGIVERRSEFSILTQSKSNDLFTDHNYGVAAK